MIFTERRKNQKRAISQIRHIFVDPLKSRFIHVFVSVIDIVVGSFPFPGKKKFTFRNVEVIFTERRKNQKRAISQIRHIFVDPVTSRFIHVFVSVIDIVVGSFSFPGADPRCFNWGWLIPIGHQTTRLFILSCPTFVPNMTI